MLRKTLWPLKHGGLDEEIGRNMPMMLLATDNFREDMVARMWFGETVISNLRGFIGWY